MSICPDGQTQTPVSGVRTGESCSVKCNGRDTFKSCDILSQSCCLDPEDFCGPDSDDNYICKKKPLVPVVCSDFYEKDKCKASWEHCSWCTSRDDIHELCFWKSKTPSTWTCD